MKRLSLLKRCSVKPEAGVLASRRLKAGKRRKRREFARKPPATQGDPLRR